MIITLLLLLLIKYYYIVEYHACDSLYMSNNISCETTIGTNLTGNAVIYSNKSLALSCETF